MASKNYIPYGNPQILLIDENKHIYKLCDDLLDLEDYFKKAKGFLGENKSFTLIKAWKTSDGKIKHEALGGRQTACG